MATMTAKKAYQRVASEAESIKTDAHEEIKTCSPGDVAARQGDVYIVCVDELPASLKPYKGRQLAEGNTKGSRHIAEGDCTLHIVDESEATAILNRLVPDTVGHRQFFGPAIDAKGKVTVTHPEHGDRTIPPGKYIVTHQRIWAQEVRRTMD